MPHALFDVTLRADLDFPDEAMSHDAIDGEDVNDTPRCFVFEYAMTCLLLLACLFLFLLAQSFLLMNVIAVCLDPAVRSGGHGTGAMVSWSMLQRRA